MKIFIDFDGVIFNAKKFSAELDKIYLKNGILKTEIEKYKMLLTGTSKKMGITYSPKKLVAYLRKNDKKCQKKILLETNALMEYAKNYVFFDALFFLNKISRENIFLLSYGDVKYQKNKIISSDTKKYFSKIIIDLQNKIELIQKIVKKDKLVEEEKIFFIDDKLENLEKIEKMDRQIITIWIRRVGVKYLKIISNQADYEVKNLKEALKIIKQLK